MPDIVIATVDDDDDDRDRIPESCACPTCGEDSMDRLAWDDDGEEVTCQSCKTTYRP